MSPTRNLTHMMWYTTLAVQWVIPHWHQTCIIMYYQYVWFSIRFKRYNKITSKYSIQVPYVKSHAEWYVNGIPTSHQSIPNIHVLPRRQKRATMVARACWWRPASASRRCDLDRFGIPKHWVGHVWGYHWGYTIWLFNIAMENHHL